MKKNWVNFKEIKASITFEQLLAHYGLELKPAKGSELLGLCPFHQDTKPSFRISANDHLLLCG